MVSARLMSLAVAASTLLNVAFAHPHLRHMDQHKRAVVYATVDEPTVDKIVYVDQYGVPVLTEYKTEIPYYTPPAPKPTTTPAAAPAYTTPKHSHKPTTLSTCTTTKSTTPKVYPTTASTTPSTTPKTTTSAVRTTTSSAAAAPTGPSYSSEFGKGLVFSPYTDSGGCKALSDVQTELSAALSQPGGNYQWVRIYGTDCNQIQNVLNVTYEHNIKAMLGIYDVLDESLFSSELSLLITDVQYANTVAHKSSGDWSGIAIINVGNEVVNNNGGSASVAQQCVAQANAARTTLRGVGYTGPVINVDVFIQVINNPVLCGEDEVVGANMHPFFDGSCGLEGAAEFLQTQVKNLQAACPGKKIIVTETGWPNAGLADGPAVPSEANQKYYLENSVTVLSDYVLLSAYDELWKTDNQWEVEHNWGIYSTSIY